MLKRELRALKKSEKEKDKVERDEDASPTDKGNITLFFITTFSIAKKGHTYAVDSNISILALQPLCNELCKKYTGDTCSRDT